MCQRGTLFLDEIGELPLTAQVQLLRVLDRKIIQRVGDPRAIPVDVRVVAATNRDLEEMVEKGTFRRDLYYRLSVYPLSIPPLRERKVDILPLVRHFIAAKTQEMGTTMPRSPARPNWTNCTATTGPAMSGSWNTKWSGRLSTAVPGR